MPITSISPQTVTGTLSDISGAPVTASRARMTIRLSWPSWVTGPAGGETVGALEHVALNSDGSFSLQLLSNTDLTPPNSYYVVHVEDLGSKWDTAIVVPNTGGPFNFADLITSSPILPSQYVVGAQGPPGQSNSTLDVVAGSNLSALRAVVEVGGVTVYADPTNLAHMSLPPWVNLTAPSTGSTYTVQTYGEITEVGWTWTGGLPIYIDANGVLTQTYVDLGPNTWTRIIGVALSPTKAFINPQPAILLAA